MVIMEGNFSLYFFKDEIGGIKLESLIIFGFNEFVLIYIVVFKFYSDFVIFFFM